MPLYHGTSRVFDAFEASAQEGGQRGSAFYLTDNEAVAENFAIFRHPPEIRGFDSQDGLDAFLVEHPDWKLTFRDDVGGKIVASFTTPEFIPQVITVELDVQRPLVLDEAPPDDLVAAAVDAGIPSAHWQSGHELWEAAIAHFHGKPVEESDDLTKANAELLALVQGAGYDAVNLPDERNGVAHRTWIVFDPAVMTIASRREVR